MNWKQAIEQLDMSDENEAFSDIDAIASFFGFGSIFFFETDQERIKKYWVSSWICTDTRVGLAVYTLDGEPVAVSSQSCRKCTEEISFISDEAANKTKDYILSFVQVNDSWIVDMETDLDSFWWENSK